MITTDLIVNEELNKVETFVTHNGSSPYNSILSPKPIYNTLTITESELHNTAIVSNTIEYNSPKTDTLSPNNKIDAKNILDNEPVTNNTSIDNSPKTDILFPNNGSYKLSMINNKTKNSIKI